MTIGLTEKQKMLAGQLYAAGDPELVAERAAAAAWMARYNASIGLPATDRLELLRQQLAEAGTQVGPAVQLYAADHPRDPAQRRAGKEFGRPIYVGRNVWIGGGAIVLPGVTIGDDAVIGAGSVVTRDVGPGVTVFGNPANPKRG